MATKATERARGTPQGAAGCQEADAPRPDAPERLPREIVIALPIPPSPLHPNVPADYRTRALWAKQARRDACYAAYNARPPQPFTRCRARATWYFTTQRRRDPDNLVAWLKHPIDGLTDAGIWVDDSVVTWEPVVIIVDRTQRAGVTITVWPMA